jgi:LysM repeat protein
MAVAPSGLVYTVVKGDSLSRIATKVHTSLSDLLDLNHLTTASVILPGMQLLVPAGGSLPGNEPAVPPPTYTVIKGDSLLRIAGRLQVGLADLLAVNQLTRTSVITPGMQLVVPAGGTLPTPAASPAPAPAPAHYTVARGDSLVRIAVRLNVTLKQLLDANHLTKASVIHPGMQLAVPAGGTLPAAAATSGDNGRIATVLAFAHAQLGEPYRFNAAGPDSWDCSGLTLAAYAQIGIVLPHYSAAQARLGTAVDWTAEDIQPGDLVFLESSSGSGVISHVGIATGSTQWIQATRTGDVVRVGAIPMSRVVAVRRYVQP